MRVDKGRLGPMQQIGKGAEGVVYELTAPSVPGLSGPLAYKEALPGNHHDRVIRAMEHAVSIRDGMDPTDRAILDDFTTWPLAVVDDNGKGVGALMPLIPKEFFVQTNPPGRAPGRVVFEFAFLCPSDSYINRMGIDRRAANDPMVRAALVGQLTYVIALLHKHDVVYGDLSLRNVAISANPPRLRLLDCDPAAKLSNTARHQLSTPFFTPPESPGASQQDLRSDVYKLALCVLRGLVNGRGVTQLMDPQALRAVLDAEGVRLIKQALDPLPTNRPSARELYIYFERTVLAGVQPPVLQAAAVDRPVRMRGQDVVVTWTATGAKKIRILGPNGFVQEVGSPSAFPRGFTITPPASGEFLVEASNGHGTTIASAGWVDLYDLPPFTVADLHLPIMPIPALEPVKLPAVLSALPARPMVSSATHPVPRLAAPDIASFIDQVRPGVIGDPLATVSQAVAGTTASLLDDVRNASKQVSQALVDAIGAHRAKATSTTTAPAPPGGKTP
ncbi:hypothetical protein OHA72_05910 [Dactylosporangium sp. NBC_01737]|uniref:hypothetical protein n=1 Tax=Dactylosporangium sp. NBC_01737 TaxID=2975959 RepID=UPI002E11299D|nr:hypothetical protein OHA72_05910 [Dactylosporangium sp. NBC_01737]